MNITFENLGTIIGYLFGGTGIIAFLSERKKRKAEAQVTEANAVAEMQKSYTQFVQDTNAIISELRKELESFKSDLKKYKDQCQKCVNNKL